jgi:hypothetical protein
MEIMMEIINKISGHNEPPQSGMQVQNSRYAQKLAVSVVDSYKAENSCEESELILQNGFDKITNTWRPKSDEKALAELGVEFGKLAEGTGESAEVQLPVMSAIASGITGAAGAVIAKTTLDAAVKSTNSETKNEIIKEGYDEISQHPGKTDQEEELLKFAGKLENITETHDVQHTILSTIAGGTGKTVSETIIKATLNIADKTSDTKSKVKILKKGLKEIETNRDTTQDEKEVAKLALKFDDLGESYEDDLRVQKVFMDRINDEITVPMGEFIAETTLEAADKTDSDISKSRILNEGFKEIKSHPDTTEDEKTIAGLAVRFGSDSLEYQEKMMKRVSSEEIENTGEFIVDMTLEVADKTSDTESKVKIMKKGLEEIQSNPDATEDQKEVAKLALKFDELGESCKDDLRVQKVFMDRITDEITVPMGEFIAETTLEAADKTSDTKSKVKILKKGLKEIETNRDTTQDEKEVAKLALKFDDLGKTYKDDLRVQKMFMDRITDEITVPIGEFIVETTLEAADKTKSDISKSRILNKGFKEIKSHPDTTEIELAQKGIETLIHDSDIEAAQKLMKTICEQEKFIRIEMEDFLKDDKDSADQEQLPQQIDDKVKVGDNYISLRKQGPPPAEIG